MNEEQKTRSLDLLAAKAVFGLDDSETKELEKLRPEQPEFFDDSFEQTAATIHLNRANASEQMPSHLRNKILAQAENHFAASSNGNIVKNKSETLKTRAKRQLNFGAFGGWTIAAIACLALVYVIWFPPFQPKNVATNQPQIFTLSQQREQLIASASDLRQISWSETGTNQNVKVGGDVVWSDEKQQGFMRFRGLPTNDKARETYQLWIFAVNQDEKYPIDGGIFDASQQDANGEIIVPIKAKLHVEKPVLFAVSIEKPNGVVVSKREKIIAVAKPTV